MTKEIKVWTAIDVHNMLAEGSTYEEPGEGWLKADTKFIATEDVIGVTIKCKPCDGTGVIHTKDNDPCIKCWGDGFVFVRIEQLQEKPRCEG